MKNSLRKKLEEISNKHYEIENLLSDKDVINDMDKYKNLSVEYARLEIIVKDYKKYLINEGALKESEEIAKNETGELKKLADEEIKTTKEEISILEKNYEKIEHSMKCLQCCSRVCTKITDLDAKDCISTALNCTNKDGEGSTNHPAR